MCFYGAIEQLLSGWIFGLVPETEEEFERAKGLVVEAICGGLESARHRCAGRVWLNPAAMDNELVKRLMWSGLLAGVGALTTIVANRIAAEIWVRVFKEDPPSTDGRARHSTLRHASGRARSRTASPSRRAAERRRRRSPSAPSCSSGAAFVGGLVLAQLLKRIGR